MTDETIINYYKKGYTIDYITKIYHKYKNRNKKPITIGTYKVYPVKLMSKNECRLYICSVIYDWQIKTYMARTQTTS